jgi:Tol biopolymer transport system component
MQRGLRVAAVTVGCGVFLGCAIELPQSRAVGGSPPSDCLVDAPRAPRPTELPDQQREDPPSPNDARGPDGLRAVVKIGRDHHPRIFLEDSTANSSRLLIDRFANKPSWAPDGKRIACSVWKSRQRPWELCVLDLARGDTLYPALGASAVKYRWSANSRFLAVEGTIYGRPTSALFLVDPISGGVRLIDSLDVFSDYELSWSPNSRAIAVVRPVELLATEDVAESELWMFNLVGHGCRLMSAGGAQNHYPQWIDDARLLFVREWRDGLRSPQSLVLDMPPAARHSR